MINQTTNVTQIELKLCLPPWMLPYRKSDVPWLEIFSTLSVGSTTDLRGRERENTYKRDPVRSSENGIWAIGIVLHKKCGFTFGQPGRFWVWVSVPPCSQPPGPKLQTQTWYNFSN